VYKNAFSLLGFLKPNKQVADEDGLVTLSVISHGHREEIETLLEDIARCKIRKLAQIVITLNLSEERPRVPRGIDVPIHWCGNPYPKGFGANHNAAFRYCNTEYFAVVNPDIRFHNDPFAPLLEHAGKEFGLVAPRVLDVQGRIADAARGLITPLEIVARRIQPRAPLRYPAWMAGMFLVFRAEAYRGVSGFDERFHLYCEDFDICARVRLLGWPISLCDNARVIHDARRASHDSPQHLFWHLCSLLRMWTTRAWWRYRKLLKKELPHRLSASEEFESVSAAGRTNAAVAPAQAREQAYPAWPERARVLDHRKAFASRDADRSGE